MNDSQLPAENAHSPHDQDTPPTPTIAESESSTPENTATHQHHGLSSLLPVIIPVVALITVIIAITFIFITYHKDAQQPKGAPEAAQTGHHQAEQHFATTGQHCAHQQVIVVSGQVNCAQAHTMLHTYLHHKSISHDYGYQCSSTPPDVHNFYDFWCTQGNNAFFGTHRDKAYKNIPPNFTHWEKDTSPYARVNTRGIDFKTADGSIQCINTVDDPNMLLCAGQSLPGRSQYNPDMPNNTIIFVDNKKPSLTFGQNGAFSHGKNAILQPHHSIYYRGFACTTTTSQVECVSTRSHHGFTAAPHKFHSW